ncbi:MAG: glycosyltransferase [Promethearchaeota archaeon]
MLVIFLWLIFCALSFGVLGLNFVLTRRAAAKPWKLNFDRGFTPSVSFLVPTYNESDVIRYKLENLHRLDYPKNLIQILIVDSNSTDCTIDIVREFVRQHPELNVEVLLECERGGKSAALNSALSYVKGDLVIVSDADCFYPNDVLQKALPYLSDPQVGAISGPKILLNSHASKVARNEAQYLKSVNLAKLGESKTGFTPLFEGGFSAYKRSLLSSFDPYKTGSDDCGTVIKLAEDSYRALLVPEAAFFTTFPISWKERFGIKIRRGNQLIRVFGKYLQLLLAGRIKSSKRVILTNTFIYLFCPVFFVFFLGLTLATFAIYPYLLLLLLLLVTPRVGSILLEAAQSFLILFFSILAVSSKKNFLIWKKPADRHLITEDMLRRYNLI